MKLQRISELQHTFSFLSSTEQLAAYRERFFESDLGKIYQAVPWDKLVKEFGLKPYEKGPRFMFSPRGRIALMFLKHHAGCSDRKLIEQLNSNIDYQFFCDIHLGLRRITNYKIVSQIRCELSGVLEIDALEKVFYTHWKPYIDEAEKAVVDATCYESEVRYPTNQKQLWEAVEWLYKALRRLCRALEVKLPRSKYLKWKKRYIGYSKMRKKTVKKRRSLTRALLRLLDKFLGFEKQLLKGHAVELPKRYHKTVHTIRKIYQQQLNLFTTGEKPKGRIVSIGKDYLRPIVRGKEIKKVEFGAKVNKLQIDGINFIELISFDNFNEGTRLKSSVYKAQRLTRKRLRVLGADAIYATNANRRFVTKHSIKTDFKPKGPKGKHHKEQALLKGQITKERASRLEGSFGKEKEHYHLKKVKAKTRATEILWIFFGIHTANCLEIGRRMAGQLHQQAA
ncbi:transposase [Sinomicrobium pectinilyticum]|uniref:Transposase n=1 Tax=Sinomicrobium pectinilyticum TaxID=1084421 RepID=A0A3N0EKU7_SINP1|nr:transposase [Sinomicrobium pectinilyticum]RNL88505.1 transposase [Sinomicrobium pectinilyticum]